MPILNRFRNRGYKARLKADLRSARDVGVLAPLRFALARSTRGYRAIYDLPTPLVSILIPTYNRGELLVRRAVASSLAQTYTNIEVLVVGDCCTDDTAKLMAEVRDPRVTFVNLPERGDYPADPALRWLVAGYAPFERLTAMARGDFITHLDHDDEHAPDRVEKLLAFIRETRADLVYHPFRWETAGGEWMINEASKFWLGSVTTSSVFYHRWFRQFGADPRCYRYLEPGDWNRFRKFLYVGARIRRFPEILLTHYKEQSSFTQS